MPKILVVDDSWTEMVAISTLLRNHGFEVVTAGDGQEALEKVYLERPDGIVLDVVLPKLSGFQVCRRLKDHEMSKHIPIALLSGKNTPLDISWGLRHGASMYLTKPCSEEDLISSVQRLVMVQ